MNSLKKKESLRGKNRTGAKTILEAFKTGAEFKRAELIDQFSGSFTSDLKAGIKQVCGVTYEWLLDDWKKGNVKLAREGGKVIGNFYAVTKNYNGILDDLVRRIKRGSERRRKAYCVDFGGRLFVDDTLILGEAVTAKVKVRAKRVYLFVVGPVTGQWQLTPYYAKKLRKADYTVNSGLTVEVIPLLEGTQKFKNEKL